MFIKLLDESIEVIFTAGLFINAALYLPQVLRIIKKKQSQDVSLITFLGFNIINFFVVLHAIIKHDILLLLGYGVTLIINTIVTILIIYYRVKK